MPGVGWGEVVRAGLPEEVSQRLRQEGQGVGNRDGGCETREAFIAPSLTPSRVTFV